MSIGFKVVNLGLPKSGTTTLARALRTAGLKVGDWKLRRIDGKQRGFVGRLMYKGYYETGDPLAMLAEYDAFTEISVIRDGRNYWPQTDWGLISAIRAHHPDTRFLLSTRDPVKHAESMRRWSDMGQHRLPKSAVPGLPKGHGATVEELARWIESHMNFCRKVFENEEDFLEYRIEDETAPDLISGYLGLDLPWWGTANANPELAPDRLNEEVA